MKRHFWAYLAGFIDGEGCISINTSTIRRYHYYHLRIRIGQLIPLPLEVIKEELGIGSIRRSNRPPRGYRKRASRMHVLEWSSQSDVKRILKGIRPYVVLKRTQVEIALQFVRDRGHLTQKQAERLKNQISIEKWNRKSPLIRSAKVI